MSTCWTCAKFYDPKMCSAPLHYCSHECYDFGSRPYNKTWIERSNRNEDVQSFATKLVDKLHYLVHNNQNRHDCGMDVCVEAKILGL
jgi:hypothetical protein